MSPNDSHGANRLTFQIKGGVCYDVSTKCFPATFTYMQQNELLGRCKLLRRDGIAQQQMIRTKNQAKELYNGFAEL
jgi:hypothetical protein